MAKTTLDQEYPHWTKADPIEHLKDVYVNDPTHRVLQATRITLPKKAA